MLTRLWGLLRPRPKPEPFDWSAWERVMGMAAAAQPVDLVRKLSPEEAAAIAGGEWDRLKAVMLPGDELWRFHSPVEAWRAKAGRSGVVLLRDGVAVCTVVTILN
jgi:hypothetical protein